MMHWNNHLTPFGELDRRNLPLESEISVGDISILAAEMVTAALREDQFWWRTGYYNVVHLSTTNVFDGTNCGTICARIPSKVENKGSETVLKLLKLLTIDWDFTNPWTCSLVTAVSLIPRGPLLIRWNWKGCTGFRISLLLSFILL